MIMAITDDLAFDSKLATLEVEKAGVSAPFGKYCADIISTRDDESSS